MHTSVHHTLSAFHSISVRENSANWTDNLFTVHWHMTLWSLWSAIEGVSTTALRHMIGHFVLKMAICATFRLARIIQHNSYIMMPIADLNIIIILKSALMKQVSFVNHSFLRYFLAILADLTIKKRKKKKQQNK